MSRADRLSAAHYLNRPALPLSSFPRDHLRRCPPERSSLLMLGTVSAADRRKGKTHMTPQNMIVIAIVAIVAAGVAWMLLRRRRTQHLRARFGPEYEHTVRQTGSVAKAEAALE